MGERYNCTVSDMGQMTLEIARFGSGDVGEYKVHVENAFGAAAQIIQVALAGECFFHFPQFVSTICLRYNVPCYNVDSAIKLALMATTFFSSQGKIVAT